MANTHDYDYAKLAAMPIGNIGNWLLPGFWLGVVLLALVFEWLG